MADRTMEELLQAPTKVYGEAIVIPKILAENFEIKTNLLQLVQANKFYGRENDNPHTHISNFKRMTATLKYRDVSNDAIKLILFSYSLEDRDRIWYEKERPNSILTWDDLVNKFVNQFFPLSKTTHLKNEISRFTQRFEETFSEAWDRFKELLRACPHHGFSELTQIDTFYNGLTEQDQDSLNAASGGNLLKKTTTDALKIIENKLKVRYSRSKSNVSRVNTNSKDVVSKTDDRIDKLADHISNLVEIVNKQVIAPAKAVEKTCVTCGGAHAYYECNATDSNQSSVCAATGSYNQVSPPNRVSHQIPPPGFDPVQNNPNRFNQGQGNYFNQANNFNQGNNFKGNNFQNNQGYRAQMNNALNFQNLGFQNQPFLVPNNQIPPSVTNELSSYIKSNEIAIKSMQNRINVLRGDFNKQEENLRRNFKDDMRSILGSLFKNQPLTLSTLPSNTVANPKGSTAQVQPLVVPISISKPDVPRTQTKPTIPYPSRLNDQKLCEKATNQMEKFFQIFHDLHFDISFTDALLLMPKFASTIKSLLANKDKLFEFAKVLLNENCSAMLLKKLPEKLRDPELTPTRMTLELADRSITRLKGVAEDVFVKMGKFHFLTDFVVVDFEADPRVPLILGRSFLRTGRALIDVYGEEITLRVNDESINFNLDQVMRYSDNYVSRVNVINIASEEVVQDNAKSSNPTLVSESDFYEDPIVKTSLFGESDFFSEEIENFLKEDLIPMEIENSVFDPEGDILFIEKLLNEDPCQLHPMNLNQEKSLIEEPVYLFSMGYEHLITTPVTELVEVTESSVKNLVPIQSEYEVTLDEESEYNEPIKDDSFLAFTTFTNPLFYDKDDFTIHDEDVPIEESKVYSNPLFDDDKIYSDELESHCLNVESIFVESLSNHDTVKFDHLEEFSGALMPIRIAEEERIRREHAEYISLMERLITINPCPRLMENANTIVESLPSSLIPVQDNDSQREEIDIVTDTDELLPPGFENDDLEEEINVVEELLVDNPIPRSENELSDFNRDDLLFLRPPPEPPDVEFDFEPNLREVILVAMNDNDELIDDECFDPGGEIDVSTNVEDDDYFPFIFFL
uniref:Retrotransposon gag domain-containing protein n=1 Tax=Tanacetum cinerariifolium TaxID=118510 RepID=A0A6L2N5I8_TANCI|nr:hypothetical protein [Tanacetum cinerariifolium]